MTDRRQSPRKRVDLLFNKYIDGYPHLCRTIDVSEGGLLLERASEPQIQREFYHVEIGLMDRTRADWVDDRMPPTVLVTGVGGGHDLNLRDLEEQGTTLLGTLRGVMGDRMHLADDAEAILAAADQMCDETVRAINVYAAAPGSDIPPSETPRDVRPRVRPSRLSLREAGITSIIWSTGYSFDYDWVQAPCLSGAGQPLQQRGVGQVHGLYFLGLHWMHTFKAGTFLGIGDDAAYVIDHLVTHALGS